MADPIDQTLSQLHALLDQLSAQLSTTRGRQAQLLGQDATEVAARLRAERLQQELTAAMVREAALQMRIVDLVRQRDEARAAAGLPPLGLDE